MQFKHRPMIKWALAALLPLVLFFVVRVTYLNTPRARFNALLVALATKDEPEIRHLTTAKGLVSLKTTFGEEEFLADWQFCATQKFNDGSTHCIRLGWNQCKFITKNTGIELVFLKTADGWRLNEVSFRD